jgi:pimeloyl-ACP methyl ester carboxylesterase
VALLLDAFGVRQADVLGYSQGGAVAQQFARAHPGRVRRLVLACTFACNALTSRERLEGWLALWVLRVLGPGRLTPLLARGTGGPPLSPEQVADLRRLLAANGRRRAAAAYRAMLAFDSRGWLGEIAAPTLVVCGADDAAVPRWHAEQLARGIRGAELRVVPEGGHFLIWTHPARLVEHVGGWLAQTTA